MTKKELLKLTDEELLKKAKKLKYTSVFNAFIIGFMIGVVIWSVIKNNFGFLMLIPLFITYKLINNSKYDKLLKEVLIERNLK